MSSDGSSPTVSNANTPDSGDLLDDHVGDTGKTSPMSLTHTSVEKSSNLSSEPMSLPVNSSSSNMSTSPSNHHPVPIFSSNQNQSSNLASSMHIGSVSGGFGGGSNNVNSQGPSSMNRDSSSSSHNNNPDTSPISLPAWGTEKRSVRELAASLVRQQNQQQDDSPKKKGDSLPRNVPAGTNIDHQQGLHDENT